MNHDERLVKALLFNKERIASRKAGQIATRQLIREDALTEDEIADLIVLYPEWAVGVSYVIGDLVRYNDQLYEVIQAHTSQSDWTPDIVPALFKPCVPEGIIPEWQQPTGAHDAYNTGDRVTFEGKIYESLIDANTWSPTEYPAGWLEIV